MKGPWMVIFGWRNDVEFSNLGCGRVNPFADDRIVPVSVFSEHEVDQLHEVRRRLEAAADDVHKRGDVWYDPWLPAYGCALQKTKVNAAVVKLEVLFVDGWERTLHFLLTGECVHSAVPKAYHVLHCADLDSALEENFNKKFDSKLWKAQQGKGSKRSAAINDLGHQKTPQFIAAVVRRAVAAVTSAKEENEDNGFERDKRFSPHGGTTDVGQHTGGRPRDTCWPLVHAAISRNLCCGPGLFRKTMAMFHLGLLKKTIYQTQGAFRRGIDVKSGCDSSLVELLDGGYDVSGLQDECAALRANVDELIGQLNRQSTSQYHLPDSTALQQLNALSSEVLIESPKRGKGLNGDEDAEERRRRALGNLNGCWFIDGAMCSLRDLLGWEKTTGTSNANKCVLVLRTVETFMFTRSHELVDDDQVADNDEGQFVEQMQSLVTAYQNAAATWRQLPRDKSVLDVEQRSRELLVLWIAFCLVHKSCVVDVPLCAEYNIALDWKDLKVAVLSERAAISALQNVAEYSRGWNDRTKGLQLFHMTNQGPTFGFARRFGLDSSAMVAAYNRTWVMKLKSIRRSGFPQMRLE
ncbi:hypothetical protein PHYSODRAFT_337964 [Phytophthora sojae]|uniref:Uncharacterized protein n=1 Tax=Phytophthora sojae (strain P6497) TaxID=1094619 RepID=G4ZZT8_PHYSP|nr:hypothetical protein PHYSODRAFT_337964 [Phytophthora sojae]EGZ11235.1 hypothetical protein PHYSODRAFT_337964 [Phytophthora sojae]|eukprot:XP_009533980.1 hypothetical protein PHYSODRAFT_337964 [Phytophthora sojae]